MSIQIVYGIYTSPSVPCYITDFSIKSEFKQTVVSGKIHLSSTTDAGLSTLENNLIEGMKQFDVDLALSQDGAEFAHYKPSDNTGFQITARCNSGERSGTYSAWDFSINVENPSINASGSFPQSVMLAFDDAERITATFTGRYTAKNTNSASINYENAATGAKKSAEDYLLAKFPTYKFQYTGDRITDAYQSDGVYDYTLGYIQKFITDEEDVDYDIKNLQITMSASGEIGKTLSATVAKESSHKTSVKTKTKLTSKGGIVTYSISCNIAVKSTLKKYPDLQTEYKDSMKLYLWNHLKDNYLSKGVYYSQSAKAYIESESVTFNSTDNTVSVSLTIIAPANSGYISYVETFKPTRDLRKIRERILDGDKNSDNYFTYSHGRKITASFNFDVVSVLPIKIPPKPTVSAPAEWGDIKNKIWDIDSDSIIFKQQILTAVNTKGVNTTLYHLSYSANYTLTKIQIDFTSPTPTSPWVKRSSTSKKVPKKV